MKFTSFFLSLLLASILLISCSTEVKSEEKTKSRQVEEPIATQISKSELSEAQLKDIETIHATFSEVYPISLNESIKNFKQDQDPTREIEIWLNMVKTFKTLTSSSQYSTIEEKQEVFSVILASTMMPLQSIKENVEFSELVESEVEDIYNLFMSSFSNQ